MVPWPTIISLIGLSFSPSFFIVVVLPVRVIAPAGVKPVAKDFVRTSFFTPVNEFLTVQSLWESIPLIFSLRLSSIDD